MSNCFPEIFLVCEIENLQIDEFWIRLSFSADESAPILFAWKKYLLPHGIDDAPDSRVITRELCIAEHIIRSGDAAHTDYDGMNTMQTMFLLFIAIINLMGWVDRTANQNCLMDGGHNWQINIIITLSIAESINRNNFESIIIISMAAIEAFWLFNWWIELNESNVLPSTMIMMKMMMMGHHLAVYAPPPWEEAYRVYLFVFLMCYLFAERIESVFIIPTFIPELSSAYRAMQSESLSSVDCYCIENYYIE